MATAGVPGKRARQGELNAGETAAFWAMAVFVGPHSRRCVSMRLIRKNRIIIMEGKPGSLEACRADGCTTAITGLSTIGLAWRCQLGVAWLGRTKHAAATCCNREMVGTPSLFPSAAS